MDKILLEMKNISKSFPGVKALDNVNLSVKSGHVHALMGENGAGKSTLMKCLFGIYSCDSGEIFLDGKKVSFKNPREALENGVAMVHQELNQALRRNVCDNIWLGRYPVKYGLFVNEKKMASDTREIFEKLGVDTDIHAKTEALSVSRRQMVEIAKAVSYGAKVIVFDEPTSSLNREETEKLFEIIEMLKKEGCGVIYISHKMEEILRISDEVTVMRDGRHISTNDASELTVDEIIKLMVGRELKERFPQKKHQIGEVRLEVKSLSGKYSILNDVNLSVRRGEIRGIAGLGGAGRSELLEAIFGLSEATGEIVIDGKAVKINSPRDAIRTGIALVTEERRATGIFGVLDIRDNTVVSSLKNFTNKLFLSDKKMNTATDNIIKSMSVRTSSRKTKIKTLSGGNQQKVIIGRWLLTEPKIFLLDEPTRGIDVGAKYEIYNLILSLAEKGCAVIMVSSEMPELMGICDSISVMSNGRLAETLSITDATQEKIMSAATMYL